VLKVLNSLSSVCFKTISKRKARLEKRKKNRRKKAMFRKRKKKRKKIKKKTRKKKRKKLKKKKDQKGLMLASYTRNSKSKS